jgi:hypothetical protein
MCTISRTDGVQPVPCPAWTQGQWRRETSRGPSTWWRRTRPSLVPAHTWPRADRALLYPAERAARPRPRAYGVSGSVRKCRKRGLNMASAAPEPAEIAQAPRSSPRAVGDQRQDRAFAPSPWRGGAGSLSQVTDRSRRSKPVKLEVGRQPPTTPAYTIEQVPAVMAVTLRSKKSNKRRFV